MQKYTNSLKVVGEMELKLFSRNKIPGHIDLDLPTKKHKGSSV